MGAKKRKRDETILIASASSSSSSDDDLEGEEDSDFEVEEEYKGSSDDEDQSAHSSEAIEYVDDEDEDEDEIEDDDEVLESNFNDVGEQCDKVVHLLQRRRNLDSLKLEDCKAYLRKHGLRISGVKATCIKRIVEHWRMKDGTGENLFPSLSFSINCTGDVCRGDVILFKQRVYEKFDKIKHGGRIIGKRTIAGRVVKESYGAAKQQHTFTVEVLWSKGIKALPPLHPLLIKGRNLYRLKTFRQKWRNEAARSKVLAEKHSRGQVARRIRALAKARSLKNGPKYQQNCSGGNAVQNNRRRNLEPSISNPKQKKTSMRLQHSNNNTVEGNINHISYSSNTWAREISHRSNTGQSSWHNRGISRPSSFGLGHYSNGGSLHHHQPLGMGHLSHVDPRNSSYFYPYCVPLVTSNGPGHQFHHADLRSHFLPPPMHFYGNRPP